MSRIKTIQLIDSRQAIEAIFAKVESSKLSATAHCVLAERLAGKHVSLTTDPSITRGWNLHWTGTYVPWASALGLQVFTSYQDKETLLHAMAPIRDILRDAYDDQPIVSEKFPAAFKERGLPGGATARHLIRNSSPPDIKLKTLLGVMTFFNLPLMLGRMGQ